IALGATTYGEFHARSSAPLAVAVTPVDPTIVEISKFQQLDSYPYFFFNIKGLAAGDTALVLTDANGAEIDRGTVIVRATDELALDGPTVDATVLEGSVLPFHVTTKTAGHVTYGTGAVTFALTGLTAASSADSDLTWWGGDDVWVQAGTGSIDATAPDATAHVTTTTVPLTAVTVLTPSATEISNKGSFSSAYVRVKATTAMGTPVYGAECTWTTQPSGVNISGYAQSIAGNPAIEYGFGGTAGDYTATCTIGSLATPPIAVHIHGI
ncbi:MAG TPA: hypothetical protein VGC41_01980, partial [Kofleriaceae bacterium]